MYRLITILFICAFCTGSVYAQEKKNPKSKSDSQTTTSITGVNNLKTQKIKTKLDSLNNLNDVNKLIDTGYSLQKASNITGSVSSVNTKALQTGEYTNIFDFLQGRVSGLTVSPDPSNSSGYTIHIRGINSFVGSSVPLVVINGMPTTGLDALSSLNPINIKSISVLKDASAAIYGVRGANGVIVITTR